MKLSQKEKAARRAAFRNMSLEKKMEHIRTYYLWAIVLGLVALAILGSAVHRQLTKREPVVYLGFVNIAVGEELEGRLTDGFLRFLGADAKRQQVYLYRELYLSDDADTLNHEYAYASRMKLMGAVGAKQLDLVLMNREAYDLLSRSGYLEELSPAFFAQDAALYERLSPYLTVNDVILSDNSIEYQLGEAETHEVETAPAQNGLAVTDFPLFAQAGFPEPVYLGVIGNSPRPADCMRYLAFVYDTTFK